MGINSIIEWSPILYKYRNFENQYHISVLEKNELFFSTPGGFNDPFDCDIPITLDGVGEEDLRDYVAKALRKDPKTPYRLHQMGQTLDQLIEERTRVLTHDIEERKNVEKASKKRVSNTVIFSAAQIWDNLLMWSHYSNCHSGYCIGLDKVNLFRCLVDQLNNKTLPGFFNFKVEYQQEYPRITILDFEKDSHKMFTVKSHQWSYENEVRILIGEGRVGTNGLGRIVPVSEHVISEVILGIKTTDENQEAIINILQKRTNKPKLYKAIMKDKEFGLDRVEVLY